MKKIHRCPSFLTTCCIPVFLAAAAVPLLAQTNGGKGQGLDKLDEQRVMGQLASYKLTGLLDRDFETFKIPAAEREQTLTIIKLQQLINGNDLQVAQRRALAIDIAKGFDGLLPKATDPDVLIGQANDLFSAGVLPTLTELEYFGENPVSQAQLKPVAETVKKMYAQVFKLSDVQINVLANQINNANQNAKLAQIKKLRQTKLFSEYSNNMASYALCTALPPADAQRKKLADDSVTYLKQFDNPGSGVQALMHMQIGKLQLVSGDFPAAKTTFDEVVAGKDIQPAPEKFQQNDARYFGAVADISNRNLQGAEKEIIALDTWQKQNYLPVLNPVEKLQVEASMAMLRFRLYSAQSDLTNDQDEKKKTNDQAIGVLAELLKQQPGLKDLVFDQLIARIPEQPDYASLNPLVLQAIQQQGFNEVIKKDGEPFDKAKLNKAIPAAQELVRRKGNGVDDSATTLSAYFIPYAYMKLDEKKQAAAAFMDFAEKFQNDTTKATDCMTNAEAIIGELRKADKEDQETRKLYDRFLPLAIGAPYNEKKFAYGYASLLFEEKDYKKAAEFFKQVQDTEKTYPDAQYMQLRSLALELSDVPPGDAHKELVSQVLDLTTKIDGFFDSAKDDTDKKKYVEWVVTADQIAADLSRGELKDPARSLKILTGFEGKIAGAKTEKTADLNAMRLRVMDYLDLKQLDDATKTLEQLLKVDPAAGAALLSDVLKAVGRDKDAAQASGNTAQVKVLAADQAILSGFMLESVEKDPKLADRVPEFRLYDANSKRQAAELVDDPATRKSGLEAALKQYQLVFNQHLNEGNDLAAQQGIGLAQYDLGNYDQTVKSLAPLVKKLTPTETVTVNNMTEIRENKDFWEANYKLFRSALEVYKAKPNDAEAKSVAEAARSKVLNQSIIYGTKVGGAVYHDDYAKLKDDMNKTLPPLLAKPATLKPATPAK